VLSLFATIPTSSARFGGSSGEATCRRCCRGVHAQPVVLGGSLFFLDVVFRGVKLVIELDGRLYHSGSEVFETDRWRQNLLILDGWCVLRFTSAMIDERPMEVMAMAREALEMLGAA
jgi:very-short-patch-repair endonuclease